MDGTVAQTKQLTLEPQSGQARPGQPPTVPALTSDKKVDGAVVTFLIDQFPVF